MAEVIDYQDSVSTRPPEGARLLRWAIVLLAVLGLLFLALLIAGLLSPPDPLPIDSRTTASQSASVEQQEAERELYQDVSAVLEPMRPGIDGEFSYDVKGDVVHLTGAVRGLNDSERLAAAAAEVRGVSRVETSAIDTRGLSSGSAR